MIRDIFGCLILGVAVHPVAKALKILDQTLTRKAAPDAVIVDHDHVHQTLQIGRVIPAVHISFAKAKIAFTKNACEQIIVAHDNLAMWSRLLALRFKAPTIRQLKRH